ncbi:MAG: hypothetical protein U0325_06670 [Polyangiales bacterium]
MREPEIETVAYDEVAAAYREGLLNRLRGFQVGPAFLEAWVDDEDPVEAARALFEAAREHRLGALRVRFGAAMALDVARLEAVASSLGAVETSRDAAGVAVCVRFRDAGEVVSAPRRDARAEETVVYVHDDDARTRAGDDWSLAGVYLPAARARVCTHAGPLPDTPGDAVELVSTAGAIALRARVTPDGAQVLAARVEGATGEAAAVLDALCAEVEGVPLREAVDHGVSRAELALRDRDAPPVRGIVLPENASPAFVAAQALLRGWLDAWAARGAALSRESRHHRGVAEPWRALGADAQRARVNEALDAQALTALRCARVVQSERVVLTFDEGAPAATRGPLLMQAERALKSALDAGLYVQTEERKDANRLRRL